jgi:uncharacterized protein
MYFSVTELEHHNILFDVAYPPGEIVYDDDVRQAGDLRAKGYAQLFHNTLGEIRICCQVTVEMLASCDRCLETAKFPVDSELDLYYRPEPRPRAHQEVRIDEGEVDVSFYKGDGVTLEDTLREFIFLSLPMQRICGPECKGICPYCGENRNTAACKCSTVKVDPRWSALKDL